MRIFARLIGLETEYAIRFRAGPSQVRPPSAELFTSLVTRLRTRLPTAEAVARKPGLFLANGGAVWLERARASVEAALIEGSSPECYSPRVLLACQRAQDRLLAEAVAESCPESEFRLLKNCQDSGGNSYGAQENYEVVLARGWRLALWRTGLIGMIPMALIGWAVILTTLINVLVLLLGCVAVLVAVGAVFWLVFKLAGAKAGADQEPLVGFRGNPSSPAPDPNDGEQAILEFSLQDIEHWIIRYVRIPLCLSLSFFLNLTTMRQTQRRLLAFLVSRAVLGGAGWLDPAGKFHLTEKGETRRRVWFYPWPAETQPIFHHGNFYKELVVPRWRWRPLFRGRQRMQIALGDSNLCEEAEYLRVATTLLVIDAIEAGAIVTPPMLRRSLAALKAISADPTLTTSVDLVDGTRMTALEIQRWYLAACRRFVDETPDAPEEAREVLDLWSEVLDLLETDRSALVGRLDWVTKQHLLDTAGADLPHEARKKIDLCYHELSPHGYFERLRAAGMTRALVTDAEVEQVQRFPPTGSPALRRARCIREFWERDARLKVDWRYLKIHYADGSRTTIDVSEPAE